jgi:hypothetical protein
MRLWQRKGRVVMAGLVGFAGLAGMAAAQPGPAATKSDKPVIRAHPVPAGGIKLDGRLDEEFYKTIPSNPDYFVQQEPEAGKPSTERTEFWVLYDEQNVYFCFRMWDSHPERMIINEMRHDASQDIAQNENISIIIDTFHDQRSGYYFMTNPLGARRDVQFQSETQANSDWNPVWNPKGARFDGGWTAEVAIPFKSIRYPAGTDQTWGFNLRRIVRWKNEVTHLTPLPASVGLSGVYRLQDEATLVGLKVPAAGRPFDVIPYVTARSTTDRVSRPAVNNRGAADVGVDMKVGVTKGVTADFTYNTDFAQVEDDLQQVNLTRFGVFFPERRTFFLEGQGIFDFGGQSGGGNNAGGGDIPTMFFSRQVGLARGTPVPILAGGRINGKAGPYLIGAINIQADESAAVREPSTNFAVARLRRDILRRSYIGVLGTRRAPSGGADSFTVGADANIGVGLTTVNAYFAKTSTPGRQGEDLSYMGRYDYNADRYGVNVQRLVVQRNFSPSMGFMRRTNFRTSALSARFSPRPKRGGAHFQPFRKFYYTLSGDYTTDDLGHLQSRGLSAGFNFDLMNGGSFNSSIDKEYEGLQHPFQIASGVRIPTGGYGFTHAQASLTLPPSFRVRGTVRTDVGDFYNGRKQTLTYGGRIEVTKQFIVEPTLSLNWINLPAGVFTTHLFQSRVTYTLTTRATIGTLIQFNQSSRTFSTNTRMRWEYIPGSDLYVVYTEGRTTAIPDRWAELQNRTFVVKLTRLLRF